MQSVSRKRKHEEVIPHKEAEFIESEVAPTLLIIDVDKSAGKGSVHKVDGVEAEVKDEVRAEAEPEVELARTEVEVEAELETEVEADTDVEATEVLEGNEDEEEDDDVTQVLKKDLLTAYSKACRRNRPLKDIDLNEDDEADAEDEEDDQTNEAEPEGRCPEEQPSKKTKRSRGYYVVRPRN